MIHAVADRGARADVERALRVAEPEGVDFAALLSPEAGARIEELARRARETTLRRFGRSVQLYAPVYLSNECANVCLYCGFSATNTIHRVTLVPERVGEECGLLAARGFRHLLLVAGEHGKHIPVDYIEACVREAHRRVPSVSVEVQALDEADYARLARAGCDGLVLYQETYDRAVYATMHRKGPKRDYDYRLAAPERGGGAGMRRLGIGVLLGLNPDWRSDAIALHAHARRILKTCWRASLTISLPRLRPAAGEFEPERAVTDREFVQAICALRIALPDVGIVLSTREPAPLRDALVRIAVTQVSAGSRTEPGGYTERDAGAEQFSIDDDRPPEAVAAALRAAGRDPVWKDWEGVLHAS